MTEHVKNLFEHKIPFRLRENSIRECDTEIHDISVYKSNLIICSLVEEDNYDSVDIYYEVKSFLYYLASKHAATKHEGCTYISSHFDIGIWHDCWDDDHDYKKLIKVEVKPETTNYGDVLIFNEPKFKQVERFIDFTNSIEINIDVYGNYLKEIPEEVESENEYNDHPIPPKPLEESFRIDKCVICLENEPNILFTDCNHTCTCSECEKIKPSVKCSYCRTEISKRIKI